MLLFAALAALVAVAPAQSSRKLESKAKTAIRKAIAKYVKTPVDDKPALLPEFMRYGRPGIDYLETLKGKKGYSADISVIRHRAKKMLGFDLLEKKPEKPFTHHPNYFAFGEIVLFKREGVFGGFRVLDTLDGTEGRIDVETWLQRGKGKALVQPGGEAGTKTIEGKKCATTVKPNTAYEEFEFALDFGDFELHIRFIGPAYFVVKLDGETGLAVTGLDNPKKIKSSDPHHYVVTAADLARAKELLQQYLFRVVPGCEPLQLTEAERAEFAQYEAVQIEMRYARPAGDPIVMVKFPEPGAVGFTALENAYLRNFVHELLPTEDRHILVMGGMSAGYEGNKFWHDDEWLRPSKDVVKLLRKEFVEDY